MFHIFSTGPSPDFALARRPIFHRPAALFFNEKASMICHVALCDEAPSLVLRGVEHAGECLNQFPDGMFKLVS